MAAITSKAKTRIAAQRVRGALGSRYAAKQGVVAATAAGRNLAIVDGRLVRAAGLEDVPAGAPVTLTNVGTPGMALYAPEGGALAVQYVGGSGSGGGGGGVSDHGALSGLGDDDHPQYLTTGRGDLRYPTATRTLTAGAGLTGGGDLSTDRTFDVGEGTLITVTPNAVGVSNGTAQYQIPVTGTSPFAPAYAALSGFAGNGMNFTGGKFVVGTTGLGLDTTPTQVRLTSSNNPGANDRILASDSAGGLTLQELRVGAAVTLYSAGNAGLGPDMQLAGTGLIAAENSLYINIDSTNTVGNAALIIQHDAATSGATELARITEDGHFNLGAAMSLAGTNSVNTEPDIKFYTNGLLAAEGNLYLNIDGTNTTTTGTLIIGRDAMTVSGATELFRFTESGRLGIGTNAPGYELDVSGTVQASTALRTATTYSTAKVQTPLLDTASGHLTVQPTADLLLDPGSNLVKLQAGKILQSHNYASQTTGMRVTGAGEGDFRYLYTDELHAKAFIADLEQALAGGQIIAKSVTILASDFTAPAAGGTATLHVKDLPSAAGMQVFQTNDIIRLRTFNRSGGALTITNAWGVVTSPADGGDGTQTWTFTRSTGGNAGAMTTGTVVKKDAIVLDYGTSGNGFYEVNAIDGFRAINSPYAQIVTWTTHPATGQVVRARLGNLRGIFGTTDEYGLYAGSGTANTDQFLRISSDTFRINNVPLQMWNAGGQTFNLSANGDSMWLGPSSSDKRLSWDGTTFAITGTVTANAGKIANWDILTNTLSSSNIRLISGSIGTSRLEVGDGTTAGTGAGIVSRSGANSYVLWAGDLYADIDANTPFRVTLGGNLYASNADIAGVVKATSGYIGGTTDGWAITSGQLASSNIRLISGAIGVARLEVGDGTTAGTGAGIVSRAGANDYAFWAGDLYAGIDANTPFRVTLDGDLYASSADITGAIKATSGYIGGASSGWAISSNEIASTNIHLVAGGIGTARVELGNYAITDTQNELYGTVGGMLAANSASSTFFWAGKVLAQRTSAPFRVTLGGSVTMNDATLGTLNIDTSGAYVTAPLSWDLAYGYKFKIGTTLASGLTLNSVGAASLALWNNTTNDAVSAAVANISAVTYIKNVATGAGRVSTIELAAHQLSGAGVAALSLESTTSTRRAVFSVDTADGLRVNTYKVWHEGNSSFAASSHTHAYLPTSGGTIGGALTVNGTTTVSGATTIDGTLTFQANPTTSEINRYIDIGLWKDSTQQPPTPPANYARLFLRKKDTSTGKVQLGVIMPDGNFTQLAIEA